MEGANTKGKGQINTCTAQKKKTTLANKLNALSPYDFADLFEAATPTKKAELERKMKSVRQSDVRAAARYLFPNDCWH